MDFFPPESHERRDKVEKIHRKFTGIVLHFTQERIIVFPHVCLILKFIKKKKNLK